MTNNAKGNRLQREIADHLESIGFKTQVTVRRPIWVKTPGGMKVIGSKDNDFFNVFDIIAISGGTTQFVQVTDSTSASKKVNKIDEAFPPSEYGRLDILVAAKRSDKKGVWRMMNRDEYEWRWQNYQVKKGVWTPITPLKSRLHGEPIGVEE